jgi:hypothetical protein
MSVLSFPTEERWPTAGVEVAVVDTTIDSLAEALGTPVLSGEDNLGPTREVLLKLPSGRLVLLLEYPEDSRSEVGIQVDLTDDPAAALRELCEVSQAFAALLG